MDGLPTRPRAKAGVVVRMWAVRSGGVKALVMEKDRFSAESRFIRWARDAGKDHPGPVWGVPAASLTPSQREGLEVVP